MSSESFNPNGSLQLAILPLNAPSRFLPVDRFASAGFCTPVRPARQQIAIGLVSPLSNCANSEFGSDHCFLFRVPLDAADLSRKESRL